VTIVVDGVAQTVRTIEPLVLANIDLGILFIFAISSLGVYGIILAGWAANSKYPFLGGVRSSAQMISYELAMTTSVLPIFVWMGGSLNLTEVVLTQHIWWNLFLPWQWLSALIFMVALFAETNRLPFDMPEAETELVGGYNTEYGAFKFGLFFVAEYCHIIIGSAVFVILFLGGWGIPFVTYPEGILGALLSAGVFFAKVCVLIFFFMWVRWTLPRFRYDQVMNLGWKVMLPLALGNLVLNIFLIAGWEALRR
jgi:NADH-quinone oxidoreductase subunit H